MEAGFFPGIAFSLTYFYTPAEINVRMSTVFLCSSLLSAFGNFVAAAVYQLDGVGGTPAWRWLFFIEGAPPIIIGMLLPYIFSNEPESVTWMNDRERHIAITRLNLADPAKFPKAESRELHKNTVDIRTLISAGV